MPPRYILVGARRWLQVLRTSSMASGMAIFMSRPEYSDLTHSNYRESYEWLEAHGLVPLGAEDSDSAVMRAFLATLADDGLSWLQDGAEAIPSPDFLPAPVLSAVLELGLDPDLAWQAALDAGRKVDLEHRNRIGLLGELAIVRYLQGLGIDTDHVSLRADGLGWDIRASRADTEAHVEVKTTTSLGRLRLYLSRNEYEVSLRDPAWCLAVALIDDSGALLRVANIPTDLLQGMVPRDSGPSGRWQSCSMDLASDQVTPGLPSRMAAFQGAPIVAESTEPVWWPHTREPILRT